MEPKKLSKTQQWMLDHPNDVPCPETHAPSGIAAHLSGRIRRSTSAAAAWRRKRFSDPRWDAERAKYEELMAEKS